MLELYKFDSTSSYHHALSSTTLFLAINLKILTYKEYRYWVEIYYENEHQVL